MTTSQKELKEKLEQLKNRIDRLDSFQSKGLSAVSVYNNREVKK